MSTPGFFALIRDDIRTGLKLAPPEYRARHARWLKAQQRPSGGFANRRGKPELYYTAFALRALSALDELSAECAVSAGKYLREHLHKTDALLMKQPAGAFCDAVAAASWWNSKSLCEEVVGQFLTDDEIAAAKDITQQRLTKLRRDDGGWAKTDRDGCGSLYHAFLAATAFMEMGLERIPGAWNAQLFIKSLVQADGGFLENRYSKRPGTNGCAAGIALVILLGLPMDTDPHAAFVKTMHSGEGGFYATPAAPVADLLSTYTALFTLKLLNKLEPRYVHGALRYARERESPEGGYTGFALESVVDCEYTFYGLGVEGICLQEIKPA